MAVGSLPGRLTAAFAATQCRSPKFSIEVLDEGYRAVNSALKTRYLVRPAPSDAPLTEGARERLSLCTRLPPKSARRYSAP